MNLKAATGILTAVVRKKALTVEDKSEGIKSKLGFNI